MQLNINQFFQNKETNATASYDLSRPQEIIRYMRDTIDASAGSPAFLSASRSSGQSADDKNNEMFSRIMAKLKSGKKLSAKELDFLRRTDPVLYAHAMRVQRMAESLKEQLSHAKSKQEANDMITSAMSSVSDKDPDKEYLLAAYTEISKDFHKSPSYQRLPATPEDAKKKKQTGRNGFSNNETNEDEDSDDLLYWTPLQEIIDAAPTLECRG